MEKHKVRVVKMRTKILGSVLLLTTLIIGVVAFALYGKMKKSMIEMGAEQAAQAANMVADTIDGDLLTEVLKGNCSGTEKENFITMLREHRDKCKLKYLYTLYEQNGKLYYGIDSSEKDPESVGEEFGYSYAEFQSVFEGETYSQAYIDSTENGDLISSYAPIYNNVGKVVGIVGCDFNASEVTAQMSAILKLVILVSIFALIVDVVVMLIVVNKIAFGLVNVNNKIFDLVHNEGDLTKTLEIHTGDELELIADNINKLLEHIRGIMINISENSTNLASSASQIVKDISGMELDASDVTASMEEMSATIEETSASITQITEAVENITDEVQRIAEEAMSGKKFSSEIITHAAEIQRAADDAKTAAIVEIEEMTSSMNKKLEQSAAAERIQGLTASIISITEQTKLLSLNASIEAARVGDAGFAVVAGEIGDLASNSAKVATEIRQISDEVIMAVRELAAEAERMMNFMKDNTVNAYEKLSETGNSYQSDVRSLSDRMIDFEEKSTKLEKHIVFVKDSMEAINIATEENAKAVTAVTETAVKLTARMRSIGDETGNNQNISKQLNLEVNKFKLNE